MKADIVTHSILYNTDNVKKSIDVMKECCTTLANLCTNQHVKEELYSCYKKYKVVANALIKDYSISEQEKSNRYTVLEEIVNLFFLKWEENKKCFKYHDKQIKQATIKYIYAEKRKLHELLSYNDFSILKFIDRYLIAVFLAVFALIFGVAFFKILVSPVKIETLGDLVVFLSAYILCCVFIIISLIFIQRAKKKERFIRPTASNKISAIIRIALPLLFPFLIYYVKHLWDSLKL